MADDLEAAKLAELKRANDLKEREIHLRERELWARMNDRESARQRRIGNGEDETYCHHGVRRDTYPGCRACNPD